MAFTSIGYDGSITEPQWAALAGYLGADYAVGGPDDWKVEAVAGQDRVVRIKAGDGYGHGVLDTSTADETLQLPLVASGSRWDLVCAHRDWQPPGGATTFGYVQGTATQQLPGGRLADPGVQDEQPLALVQVTAGQQMPTGIVDLRTWPSKVITAGSLLALPEASLGTEAVVGSLRYRGVLDGAQNAVWQAVSDSAFTAFQDWAWGGTPYLWTVPNGNWNDPPGAARAVTLKAGHLYQFTSQLMVSPNPGAPSGPYRISQWVGGTILREVPGYTAAHGGVANLTTIVNYWRAAADGSVVFNTRVAVGGSMAVYSAFGPPSSSVIDLGYRP